MLNIFLRSLRIGVQTTTYPDTPEPAPEAYRGQVMLLSNRCSGEGACARICPSQAIVVETHASGGWTWQLDDSRCVFCGLCEDVCPTAAISLSTEFELAVRDRNDLITQIDFEPTPSTSAENGSDSA